MRKKINKADLKGFTEALSFMLTIPVINISYTLLNNSNRRIYSLITKMDMNIPFVKLFIIPYIIWYPFLFLGLCYLCQKDRDMYYKTVISFDMGLVVCYVFYYFFQTTVPRPVIHGHDFFSILIGLIYLADKPYNCFPSIHVLTSYLLMKSIRWSKVKNKSVCYLINICGALIIISTVFIKQHVILDVASGILFGDLVFSFVYFYAWDWIVSLMEKQYLMRIRKKAKISTWSK